MSGLDELRSACKEALVAGLSDRMKRSIDDQLNHGATKAHVIDLAHRAARQWQRTPLEREASAVLVEQVKSYLETK